MIMPLLRTQMRSMGAAIMRASSKKKTPVALAVLLILLLVYSAGCGVLMFYLMFDALCPAMQDAGCLWLYWAIAASISVLLGGFVTMLMASHQLYLAKDNELLLSLPIAPRDILLSRMLPLAMFAVLATALVMWPAAVVYQMRIGFTALSALTLLLEALTLPFLILAIACLVGWVIALLQSRSRHRSLVAILLSVGLLAVYFGMMFSAQKVLGNLLNASIAAASSLRTWAAPLYWFGLGGSGSVAGMAGAMLLNLALFGLVCVWLAKSFTSIVTMRRGAAKIRYEEKTVARRSASSALLQNNLRHLFATPVWLVNGGLGSLMGAAFGVALLVARDQVAPVIDQLPASFSKALVLTVILGFCLSLSLLSPAAISLEAKTRWLLQSCPLPGGTVLRSMAAMQMLLTVPAALIGVLFGSIGLGLTLAEGLSVALFLSLYAVFTALLGVWCNLHFPKFDWVNEANAVKASLSPMLSMLLNVVILLVSGGIYAGLYLAFPVDVTVVYLLIWAALCAAGSAVTLRWLDHQGASVFATL